MKTWSLKVKVGVYSAILTVLSLAAAASVLLPFVYFRQVAGLDRELEANAEELFRDLQHFRGAPVNPRRPLKAKFIPLALRDRFLIVEGPEGQILFKSPNLGNGELKAPYEKFRNARFAETKCRVGSFRRGEYSAHIGTTMTEIDSLLGTLLRGLAIASLAAAAVVFMAGFWVAKRAVAPVSELTAAAEKISLENIQERLPVPSANDEIARLTEVLNATFERLQNSYRAATRFSADASHQLKTPVTVLRAGLESIRQRNELETADGKEVDNLLKQTRRLTALIEDLLLLSQADAGRLPVAEEDVELTALLGNALDDLGALGQDRFGIETSMPETLKVRGNRRHISLILQNLTENAAKYTPAGGSVRIEASSSNSGANLRFSNSGSPIAKHDQEGIFERFRRGSGLGENIGGHGLGLNIARVLARAQGGDVRLIRSDQTWTVFELELKLALT